MSLQLIYTQETSALEIDYTLEFTNGLYLAMETPDFGPDEGVEFAAVLVAKLEIDEEVKKWRVPDTARFYDSKELILIPPQVKSTTLYFSMNVFARFYLKVWVMTDETA